MMKFNTFLTNFFTIEKVITIQHYKHNSFNEFVHALQKINIYTCTVYTVFYTKFKYYQRAIS